MERHISYSDLVAVCANVNRMHNYIDLLKREPVHQDTAELFYARELEHKREQDARAKGIALPSTIPESLIAVAEKHDVNVNILK